MKTLYVDFDKTVSCRLSIAVPDHWDWNTINRSLHMAMIHNADLKETLDDLDWDLDGDPARFTK